jgi:hypothetical protein
MIIRDVNVHSIAVQIVGNTEKGEILILEIKLHQNVINIAMRHKRQSQLKSMNGY